MTTSDVNSLFSEGACFACFAGDQAEILKLVLLSQIASNSSTGTASFAPIPIDTVYLYENFITGSTASASMGKLGWIVSASSLTRFAHSDPPYFATWRFTSAAAANSIAYISLGTGSATGAGWMNHIAVTGWKHRFIFKFDEVSNVHHRIGVS